MEFADVIFVIDSSNSIIGAGGGLDTFWIMQLDFISRIIERDSVEIGPDLIRIGLVVFGNNVIVEQELSATGRDKDAQVAKVYHIIVCIIFAVYVLYSRHNTDYTMSLVSDLMI